ncbi:MAG: xanthine/uracil/vitamin C permease [Cyanobacteriota bacterium]|nr:xanthine/uracil/vitamin C permease [Cyanobacteriota bacterium]
MLSIYFFLLLIGAIAIFVKLYVRDEVHHLAAISTGAIAFIWGFSVSPPPVKLLMGAMALGIYFRFQVTHH